MLASEPDSRESFNLSLLFNNFDVEHSLHNFSLRVVPFLVVPFPKVTSNNDRLLFSGLQNSNQNKQNGFWKIHFQASEKFHKTQELVESDDSHRNRRVTGRSRKLRKFHSRSAKSPDNGGQSQQS